MSLQNLVNAKYIFAFAEEVYGKFIKVETLNKTNISICDSGNTITIEHNIMPCSKYLKEKQKLKEALNSSTENQENLIKY